MEGISQCDKAYFITTGVKSVTVLLLDYFSIEIRQAYYQSPTFLFFLFFFVYAISPNKPPCWGFQSLLYFEFKYFSVKNKYCRYRQDKYEDKNLYTYLK